MNESLQEPRGAEISCTRPDYLISVQYIAVVSSKDGLWTSPVPNRQALTDYHLSCSIPSIKHSIYAQTGLLSVPFVLMIAAVESMQFVQYALLLSNPLFYNRNTL